MLKAIGTRKQLHTTNGVHYDAKVSSGHQYAPILQRPTTMRMSVKAWCAVPENLRQRNTEKHAKKATRPGGHLRVASPAHAQVFAAKLPDGRLIKLDGHTRALLWELGELDAPEQVLVTVIPVRDMEHAKELYNHFDNAQAMETTQDKLSGALHEHGVVLRSGCFLKLYASSLMEAHRLLFPGKSANLYDVTGVWKPVLEALDICGYGRVLAAVQTAMLLSAVRYAGLREAPMVESFWTEFFLGAKSGTAGRWLPAEALRYVLEMEKVRGAGNAATERWIRYTLAALDQHIARKTYRGKVSPSGPVDVGDRSTIQEWVKPAYERLAVMSMENIADLIRCPHV